MEPLLNHRFSSLFTETQFVNDFNQNLSERLSLMPTPYSNVLVRYYTQQRFHRCLNTWKNSIRVIPLPPIDLPKHETDFSGTFSLHELMMTSSNGNISRVTGPLCGDRWTVNSPHKDQWCWALMFSLICARINGWVNNREAVDLM